MTSKELKQIGLFGVLYFLCVGVGTAVELIAVRSGNMILAPAFSGVTAGVTYMTLLHKVPKWGGITFLGLVMASFFFLSGHYLFSFLPNLICGLLADGVAKMGHYRSKWHNLVSYILFSLGNLGPILLMWFARDAYIQQLLKRGKDMAYVNRVMLDFSVETLLFLIGTVTVGALIGGLLGQYFVRKRVAKVA
ncbi:energy-coupling factor transport system substrate-specific component [Streptococcus rupicaprae]|uniref:Energy-coupling factor transport system substrate-specific component n=1 Tax=Streptococcus rupicaprae TaxID=759619 RepID=A0ABV2FHZ5_9STRE